MIIVTFTQLDLLRILVEGLEQIERERPAREAEEVAHRLRDLRRRLEREWTAMVSEPLFQVLGGDASPEAREAYIQRRLKELGVANA